MLTTRIEVRPIIKGLAGFGGIDDLLEERNDDLVKVHPIDPASVPNFAFGLDANKLSPTTPKSIFSSEHLELMDAGELLIIYLEALERLTTRKACLTTFQFTRCYEMDGMWTS